MAALIDADRVSLWAKFMSSALTTGSLTKTELRAAINAADDYADSIAAAYNAALPQPARGALSAKEKAALLVYVISKRFEVS